MKTEINDKVLAMYHAVWAMVDEGQDMSRIKVSDITTRAGIGKGTAYEYFRSKEEILSKALWYDFHTQYQILLDRIRKRDNFRDALVCCLDWLEETEDRRRFCMQLLRGQSCPVSSEEKAQEFLKMQNVTADAVNEVLGYAVSLGREEGLIRDSVTDKMAILQILSQLIGFFIYGGMENPADKEEIQVMKQFLCDNIEKSLK